MPVLTRTRTDLKQPKTTYNEQEMTWNNLQRPKTTYNEQETTWKNLQRVADDLKWSTTGKAQPTTTWTYQQHAKEDSKQLTRSRFWEYFTIWYDWFSSLTRVPPIILLQSFQHCFIENHLANRRSNICI